MPRPHREAEVETCFTIQGLPAKSKRHFVKGTYMEMKIWIKLTLYTQLCLELWSAFTSLCKIPRDRIPSLFVIFFPDTQCQYLLKQKEKKYNYCTNCWLYWWCYFSYKMQLIPSAFRNQEQPFTPRVVTFQNPRLLALPSPSPSGLNSVQTVSSGFHKSSALQS